MDGGNFDVEVAERSRPLDYSRMPLVCQSDYEFVTETGHIMHSFSLALE